MQHGQAEADQKPHLYGASLANDNVAAHVSLEKPRGVNTSSDPSVREEDDGMGGVRPTPEEMKTLRKVGEPLPKSAFLVAVSTQKRNANLPRILINSRSSNSANASPTTAHLVFSKTTSRVLAAANRVVVRLVLVTRALLVSRLSSSSGAT